MTKNSTTSRRDFIKQGLYSLLVGSFCLHQCRRQTLLDTPNILLICLDTTRVDRLGCYGYSRPTSPNLDRLAEESQIFTQAISTSSWTLPAHASLFTGKFTSSHGATLDPAGPLFLARAIEGAEVSEAYRARGLAVDETTLAEILGAEGYRTGAIVGGPWLKRVFSLAKGFDDYDDQGITSINGRLAQEITDRALKWLHGIDSSPFFLFLNYFDPHSPYFAPEGYAYRFFPPDTTLRSGEKPSVEETNALYDAEILYMDHYIGVLFNQLKKRNLFDSTWIIVLADHGELLGEHGLFSHGHFLTQEEIHIPLIVKPPLGEYGPAEINDRIQTVDILPMICDRLDVEPPVNTQGSVPSNLTHPIVSEAYPLSCFSKAGHWQAIYDGKFKFCWNSKGNHGLIDLDQDPRENHNLYTSHPNHAQDLERQLKTYLSQLPKWEEGAQYADEEIPVDEETIEALRGLGYLQ